MVKILEKSVTNYDKVNFDNDLLKTLGLLFDRTCARFIKGRGYHMTEIDLKLKQIQKHNF